MHWEERAGGTHASVVPQGLSPISSFKALPFHIFFIFKPVAAYLVYDAKDIVYVKSLISVLEYICKVTFNQKSILPFL